MTEQEITAWVLENTTTSDSSWFRNNTRALSEDMTDSLQKDLIEWIYYMCENFPHYVKSTHMFDVTISSLIKVDVATVTVHYLDRYTAPFLHKTLSREPFLNFN